MLSLAVRALPGAVGPWRCPRCLLPLPPPPSSWTRHYPTSSKKAGPNLYDDLGLDSRASSEEIRQAYLDMSMKYHPDRNPDNPEALDKFQKANEAHDVLSNPRLRRQYDRGKMGHATSVADRELSKHRFEGDDFLSARKAYRDEYGGGGDLARKNLDHYMRTSTSDAFQAKQDLIHSKPNITYGASKRDAEWRAMRKEMKGGGGGFKFVLAILMGVLAIVMMRRKS